MFITHISSYYPFRCGLKQPRQRFQTFWQDLFRLYGKEICQESFYHPGQYTFAELSEGLFEKCDLLGWLNDINLLITTNWAQEFDPDYAHFGPYLVDRFKLNCDMFDVTGQGTLSPFTALHLLQQMPVRKAILVGVEQTSIPSGKTANVSVAMPHYNGASVMVLHLSKGKHQPAYRVIACDIKYTETKAANLPTVLMWLASLGELKPCCIITRFNSTIGKQLSAQKPALRYRLIYQKPSLLASFHYLMVIFHERLAEKYLLIIEEDIESQGLALLLLESV